MTSTSRSSAPRARPRATKACQRCRVRKVRCDIVHRPDACTNCYLDDIECVEIPSKRRTGKRSRPGGFIMALPKPPRPAPAPQAEAPESVIDRVEPESIQQAARVNTIQPEDTDLSPPSPHVGQSGALNSSNSSGPGPSQCPAAEMTIPSVRSQAAQSQRSTETVQTSVAPLPDSNEDLFPDFTTSLLPVAVDGDDTASLVQEEHSSRDIALEICSPVGSISWQKALPPFIRPITSQRTYCYHDFLKSKGAFRLPSPKLRNAILSRYIEFVYPQLPVIDVHEVLNAVATNGRQGQISLLLFQSILLAGSAHVDIEYVFDGGYRSRLALREELAERVRLLYDFDCENDRLILIQSLILMTSWQEKGDEVKHLRYWISAAHNIALLLGLNRDPSQLPLPARRKSLRKRVWWTLYLRDRLLALGLRQSPLIARTECNLPELENGDFDVQQPSQVVCSIFRDCGLLQDLDQQARLAEVCIAQLQLSHHLADILQARYTTFGPKMGCTKLIALVLVPKALADNAEDAQVCSRNLDLWFRGLPDHLKYRSRLSLCFDPGQGILMLHCSILNLFYYALVCALHRPYPSPILRDLSATETCFQRKSLHAADASMSILSELQIHDLIGFLPTQGITFMLQAAITFLGDSKSSSTQLQSRNQQNLEACLQVLQCLRDVHTYSFWATNLLTTAAGKLHKRSRATIMTHAAIEGRTGDADRNKAGPSISYSNGGPPSFNISSIGDQAEGPADCELLENTGGDLLAHGGCEQPVPSYEGPEWIEYPEWIDPYVLYDNPNALDLFPEFEWAG